MEVDEILEASLSLMENNSAETQLIMIPVLTI